MSTSSLINAGSFKPALENSISNFGNVAENNSVCLREKNGSVTTYAAIHLHYVNLCKQGSLVSFKNKLLQKNFQHYSKTFPMLNYQIPKFTKLILIFILKPHKNRKTLFSTIYYLIFWRIMFYIINSKSFFFIRNPSEYETSDSGLKVNRNIYIHMRLHVVGYT